MSRYFENKKNAEEQKDVKRIALCGIELDDLTMEEAVEAALTPRGAPCTVFTPNAVMLDACCRDAGLAALLSSAELSLADGAGVLLAAKRQGTPLSARVPGIAFGEALLAAAERLGLRVFLLGGRPGVAERAADRLQKKHPLLCICGTHDGYFEKTGEADHAVTGKILAARPDILFVCFGFPMQENWIAEHRELLLGVRVIAGLGGSLDVWSGQVKRAPKWISHMRLEWAFRMLREPGRIRHLPALLRVWLRRDFSPKCQKNSKKC